MTFRERIMAVFQGKQTDIIPWFADLTYWYSAQIAKGTLPEKYAGDGVVQLYRDLRVGAHEHVLNSPWETEYHEVEIKVEYEKDLSGKPVKERIEWKTPAGSLVQVKEYVSRAYTWGYREYPVKNARDLEVLRFIYEHQEIKPNYEVQKKQIELFGEWGVASSVPPRSPMAQLFVVWMGVMNTSFALADAPSEIEKTLEVLAKSDDPIYEVICSSPAPLVYFGENITGEVVSPGIFEKYYAPYYRRRSEQIHKAGKYIFLHIDGTMRAILPLVGKTGVDCAQSLTPAPVGDVEVEEMRRLAGPQLILWGGVPGAFFSPVYSEKELADIVLRCINFYKNDSKFMLCVCDQVPPDGEIERVKMVSELVEKYGVRQAGVV